jgi:predicted RNA-binding Zn-ribbon protein involved in translation (DUF1610 family)
MPQIGPNLWKTAVSYTWYHKFRNGREEYEFDPMTGAPRRWSKPAPEEIEIAGWLPITMDLAKKIQVYGEFGIPTASPSVLINLLPGDDLVIEKEATVYNGQKVTCQACGATTLAQTRPTSCPVCGAQAAWRCPKCGKLSDQPECCDVPGMMIDPLKTEPHQFDTVLYRLGVRGRYIIEFTSNRLIVS